eukprot:CAMPEP_0194083230 /NCGR_PEP_ID=MMETSP0149-20130528/8516_1 /TAXON_ID=122233 /ORGANISM="Chaetoceros debilis, Strain MM31A-1" /LENGTH=1880 /DNA_ID=CAMNT_0038765579 /DNA_START=117 /DNA_END=5759 /DNA_ORIENTATION=+
MSIDRLLKLSNVLNAGSSGTSSTSLTLKQLINVHESLLDSILETGSSLCGNSGASSSDIYSGELEINSMLKRYVSASEVEQCESILSKVNTKSNKSEGCNGSQRALLVIQYLLRQAKGDQATSTKEMILSGLKNITLPILLSSSDRYDNLLRDAALDASFAMPGDASLNADSDYSKQLRECLDLIRSSTVKLINTTAQDANESKNHVDASVISTVAETSSCILIRILDLVEEKKMSGNGENVSSMVECHRELVKDVMQDLSMAILNAICFYSEDGMSLVINGKATILMRPITALLMPSLFNFDSTNDSEGVEESDQMSKMMTRLNDLWYFVCSLIDDNKNSNTIQEEVDGSKDVTSRRKCRSFDQVGSSVASGLLCALVDNIHSLPLSIPKHRRSNDANVKQARIIQHPTFWSFVQNSLTSGDDFNLGIDNVGMKGGAAFTSNMTSGAGNVSAGHFNPYEDEGAANYDVDQMVRRRAIHILRTVIDREYDIIQKKRRGNQNGGNKEAAVPESIELFKRVELWKKYILCFETLEIEVEAHLVDQVYPTVTELCAACVDNGRDDNSLSIPKMTWTWVASIFSRVLLSDSPSLRKLGLYRLLSGKAGISLQDCQVPTSGSKVEVNGDFADKEVASKSAKQRRKKSKGKAKAEPAPMYIISPSFILHVFIHSYDSLSTSVGTGINIEGEDGKTSNENLQDLIPAFLTKYTKSLFSDSRKLTKFIEGMLSEKFISSTKARNLVLVSNAVLDAWNKTSPKVTLSNESINAAVTAYRKLFNSGSIVFDYRQSILLSLSHILSLSNLTAKDKPEPLSVLKVLSSFPAPDDFTDLNNFQLQTNNNLKIWMESFGETWASNVGTAYASAFVRGDLIQYSKVLTDGLIETTELEKEIGLSIAKMCALGSESPSSLLWPAINKGLFSTTPFGQRIPPFIKKPETAARSVLLLVSGCKERILSGIGHGDLVVDKEGNMLPPPPNIELLISRAVNFALSQLELVSVCNFSEEESNGEKYGARSSVSNDFVNNFTFLIDQFSILKKSYPSSVIMVEALGKLLKSSTDSLLDMDEKLRMISTSSAQDCVEMVKHISVTYGVLSMGATNVGEEANSLVEEQKELHNDLVQLCSRILQMNFKPPPRGSSSTLATWQIKGMRSIFQHAKWGSLMVLLPMAYEDTHVSTPILQKFHEDIMEVAMDSVNATPAAALPALFETAVISAKKSFDFVTEEKKKSNMKKVIETFFAIMNDTEQNSTRGYMLSVTCGIIFCDRLLASEFAALESIKAKKGKYSAKKDAPILKAFRKLVKEAGSKKTHIVKYAISYITTGWLGDKDDKSKIGMSAIPYREDIAKLLIYKEQRSDESNMHQEGLVKQNSDADAQAATLPDGVPRTSVARGFLLVFISQLPDIADMSVQVAGELCQYLIFWMLDNVCLDVVEGHLVTGSTGYVQKIRAWQSLCVMARFVTPDIVSKVMTKVFKSMSQVLHGQIRYFVEVFTIQIANVNPTLFIKLFTTELLRYDISQQHVSSLMIISGNLIVGKDAEKFIKLIISTDETRDAVVLREMIAGVVPWLSSTQGFCRAIAQLLLHKLIPLQGGTSLEKNDAFFLKSISKFLDGNPEMTRLRKKQSNFFSEYSIHDACTPEGIFALESDDVDEANPPHLIEVIKKCLVDIYNEHHPSDVPEWKQLQEQIDSLSLNVSDEEDDGTLVNFQRKILPIDSLNLSLESERQSNRNAAGRDRQQLIVCASLIDKVANLAGLTRTAEIFAATRIVVPELKVNKMDNFKSISVGAEEWVDMEECKEGEDLMIFLKKHKDEGYSIIGIEQTSSSKCLSKVEFEEKTVLLLGKEKEGIPVEYLQLVDRCVEIPQFGILRSLNVHVSGAISIWEYTKQRLAKS